MRRSEFCLAVVALVTLTGCGGEPSPDLDALDLGGYSAQPLSAPPNTGEYYGRILESTRLTEVLARPADIAAELDYTEIPQPVPNSGFAMATLATPVRPVLQRYDMVAEAVGGGAETGRTESEGQRSITINLLRFRDESTARLAAAELDAADFAVSPDNVAVEISGYPGAHSHWRPTVPTLGTTIAHGSYVVSMYLVLPAPDLTALTDLARKAFDRQLTLLDTFRPTPVDQLATLALDPDDMVRRMISARTGRWNYPAVDEIADGVLRASGVTYGPNAAAAILGDPAKAAELGYDRRAVVGITNVLSRLKSATAAKQFADFLAGRRAEGFDSIAAPAAPDVKCFRSRAAEQADFDRYLRYNCIIPVDRYVATIFSEDEDDVRQRAAAQYVLLVNSR
ncbi:DUF7373 family lipoprotein [Nocardia crassostreae]|uniref:DUF7373 family lipoprotein n=1 Tax=Nocardia crassostreae TaxID=53428 RepID=UPI000833A1C0|nr:hypothetical protein [Nocardia crassostreae]